MIATVDTRNSPYAKLVPCDMAKVRIKDRFWAPLMRKNSRVSIPHQYRECERTGRMDNFRIAAGLKKGKYKGCIFNDSDVHKLMEAMAWDMAFGGNAAAARTLGRFIALAAKVQMKDGYLYTPYIIDRRMKRWSNLRNDHEIYSAGHMIQAAIAHHRALRKDGYLEIAGKWVRGAARYFGPGRHRGTCGHPEAEMALVELYRETGDRTCLDLARFFLNERGRDPKLFNGNEYMQDHLPVEKQTSVVGHAVRQLYLCCGLADLYAETGGRLILDNLRKQWEDMVGSKMYITGGVGSSYSQEAFEHAYYLPNRAYAETCAAIASFMWNWRMFLIEPDARYTDLMETLMYNGTISGISHDGRKFFYTNPLEHKADKTKRRGDNRRTSSHWDHCACCPPNVARFLATMPGVIYASDKKKPGVHVNFYMAGDSVVDVAGQPVAIRQETAYPWEGVVRLTISPPRPSDFAVRLRIPGWVRAPSVSVNGTKAAVEAVPGTYAEIRRTWKKGDRVDLVFPMPVERMRANRLLANNAGCVALKRGPVVYCIEQADFRDCDLFDVSLPESARLTAGHEPGLLGWVTVIRGRGLCSEDRMQGLYSPSGRKKAARRVAFTAIPYFAWANRKPGKMRVWIPEC